MNDSAPLTETDPVDVPMESDADAPPGFQPPTKSRYRPSEAWALRWLGNPAR